MWFARDYPSRFDGNTWEHYTDIKGKEYINGRIFIEAIAVAPDSNVYIGASPLLYIYKPNSVYPYSKWSKLKPFNLSDGIIYDIEIDSNNIPWIAYGGSALKYFDGNEWKFQSIPYSSVGSIKTIAISNDGTIFAGSPNGVYQYKNDEWIKLKLNEGIIHNYVNSIGITPDDVIWVGTADGLSRYDGTSWETYDSEDGLPSNEISHVAVSPNGDIFVATQKYNLDYYYYEGTGISRYDGNTWTTYTTDNGLPDNNCSALAVDSDGVVWAGTYDMIYVNEWDCDGYRSSGTGLSKFDGTHWISIPNEKGNSNFYIKSLAVSPTGTVYVSTSDALYTYDQVTWTKITDQKTSDGNVLFIDSYNILWIGNENNVQGFLNNVRVKSYPGINKPSSFAENSNNVLWVGSQNYLQRFEGKKRKDFNLSEWNAYEMPIAIDSNDVLWVGTGKGLLRITDSETTSVNSDVNLPSLFSITGNYPNPFNLSTTISFTLPSQDLVNLSIYNSMGQKVRDLVSESLSAGTNTVIWNGKNDRGETVSSGLYFSRLGNSQYKVTAKMLLMK